MSIIGIVCEFNPFHKGHKHLIDSVKQQGDIVVCVMSGNYVQRGEPAIFPKDIRVEMALKNGADVVLELPFVYATASAEIFARNSVKILDSFGCDKIAFGTETADVDGLSKTVDILLDNDFDNKISKHLNDGLSYPVARQRAFEEYGYDFDISTPNNILAIEYVKAIKQMKSNMIPVAVKRIGAGYNDNVAMDEFASATHIRSLINNNEDYSKYIPENLCDMYEKAIEKGRIVSYEKYNLIALTLLREKIGCDMRNIANMSEGLENRIESLLKTSINLNDLYDEVKTKRYTHSRVRRAVLSMMFGVTNDDIAIQVPYCRMLGFNTSVSNEIGKLIDNCKIPFIVNYSDFSKFDNPEIRRIFGLENKSTDIYNLMLNSTDTCSKEMTYWPKKI